jgi:hypothetical protein
MAFSLTSCVFDIAILSEIIDEVMREFEPASELERDFYTRPAGSNENRIRDEELPLSAELDKSSPKAFIDSVWTQYMIILEDDEELLYTEKGLGHMQEIEHALWLFSPEFMREMVNYFHKEHSSTYIIRLGGHNDDQYGIAEWRGNVVVTVYFDRKPALNGITAPVLAHEIGHTIHYLIEEFIGELRSERDMKSFNGDFHYAGSRYDRVWREKLHGTTFAYDYGMHCYYEDIATIFELLVEDPNEMTARLSNPNNEPLLLKTQYIREMTYRYVSDDCWMIFMPLYEAEEILGLRAAA